MADGRTDRLVRIADEQMANVLAPRFTPEAAARVRSFIRGSNAPADLAAVLQTEAQVRRAEEATRVLMTRLSAQKGAGAELDVETVELVIRGLCPGFWPFC